MVNDLRKEMRRRRAALGADQAASAALSASRHLWRLPQLARCERIAGYVAVGGEIDCAPALHEAATRGRRCYLPVLHGDRLLFAPAPAPGALVRNRYGIPEPEPDADTCLRGRDLDVVLAPLVAFDDAGNRLGMGGGFYDRSFGVLGRRPSWRRPFFVGFAYEFQHVGALTARRWDVPLHAVVTERGARIF